MLLFRENLTLILRGLEVILALIIHGMRRLPSRNGQKPAAITSKQDSGLEAVATMPGPLKSVMPPPIPMLEPGPQIDRQAVVC